MIKLIGAILSIIVGTMKLFAEKNHRKREKLKKALNDAKTGIKNNDPSLLTAGLARMRNK